MGVCKARRDRKQGANPPRPPRSRRAAHLPDADVQHGADVGGQVRDDDGAEPEVAEEPREDGPQGQAAGHGLEGDGASRGRGLRGHRTSTWVFGRQRAPPHAPHHLCGSRGEGRRYLLSQRGHDVLLLVEAYARVTHGVVVNDGEPQQTAHAAQATWEAGPS